MTDNLHVDTAELRRSANEHQDRAEGWRQLGEHPAIDADQLAGELGLVGQPTAEAMRAHNAAQAARAEQLAAGYDQMASGLRLGAQDYDTTDSGHAAAVEATFND
jgi:hypothetical protein